MIDTFLHFVLLP